MRVASTQTQRPVPDKAISGQMAEIVWLTIVLICPYPRGSNRGTNTGLFWPDNVLQCAVSAPLCLWLCAVYDKTIRIYLVSISLAYSDLPESHNIF